MNNSFRDAKIVVIKLGLYLEHIKPHVSKMHTYSILVDCYPLYHRSDMQSQSLEQLSVQLS